MSDRVVQDLQRRVLNGMARGVVEAVDDRGGMQVLHLSLLSEEGKARVERPQPVGFSGVPQVGAEVVVGFLGGNRDHGVVLQVDDRRSRIRGLGPGEIALWTDEGATLIFKRGKLVELRAAKVAIAAEDEVRVTAPVIRLFGQLVVSADDGSGTAIAMTGNISLTGDMAVSGTVTANTVTAPNGHVGP